MLNIPDAGCGLGQEPQEGEEAVNTTEGLGMGSSRRRRCILRRGEPISWHSKFGENQYREVCKFSTPATTLCAAIRTIWSWVLRQKILNAWLDLAERQKAWTIKTRNSLTSKYAQSGFFVVLANLTRLLEGSSQSAKAMFVTSIIAGGV